MNQPGGIKLYNLCLIKCGQILWQQDEVKREIRNFFIANDCELDDEEELHSLHWMYLTKRILAPIAMFPCPENCKRQLRHLTNFMGLKIYHWTKYVTTKLELDIKYALDIYFTPDGQIDRKLIFEKWMESGTLEIAVLFNVACFFCLEDKMRYLWDEMPLKLRRSNFYKRNIYMQRHYHLIAYWIMVLDGFSQRERLDIGRFFIYKLTDNSVSYAGRHFVRESVNSSTSITNLYSPIFTVEENMFRLAIQEGLEMAVKYFSDCLSDMRRKRLLNFAINMLLDKCLKSEYSEIVLFLMSKMTLSEKMNICLENDNIVEMLLTYSLHGELFTEIFDNCLQQFTENPDNEKLQLKLLNWICCIVTKMGCDLIMFNSLSEGRYQQMFHCIWRKLSDKTKYWLVESHDWMLLLKLLEIEDFDSLRLIINDPYFCRGLFTKRSVIILCMKTLFEKFDEERKVRLEDKFASEIGLDDEERIKLRIDFFNG